MAVRVYRAPLAPSVSKAFDGHASLNQTSRPSKSRPRNTAFAAADDVFEEGSADSHIVERKAQKENRAGRRELEAARRQQRELREDADFDEQ